MEGEAREERVEVGRGCEGGVSKGRGGGQHPVTQWSVTRQLLPTGIVHWTWFLLRMNDNIRTYQRKGRTLA